MIHDLTAGISRERRTIRPAGTADVRRSARSVPAIGSMRPISGIVGGAMPQTGEIRELVVDIAMGSEILDCHSILPHGSILVLVRRAVVGWIAARLQHVDAHMRRIVDLRDLPYFVEYLPTSRESGDEIGSPARYPAISHDPESATAYLDIGPTDLQERLRIECLYPEADAIHTERKETIDILLRYVLRMALDTDLAVPSHGTARLELLKNQTEGRDIEERRRATSEVDTLDRLVHRPFIARERSIHLSEKECHIVSESGRTRRRHDDKFAVRAPSPTKRDINVDKHGYRYCSMIRHISAKTSSIGRMESIRWTGIPRASQMATRGRVFS